MFGRIEVLGEYMYQKHVYIFIPQHIEMISLICQNVFLSLSKYPKKKIWSG